METKLPLGNEQNALLVQLLSTLADNNIKGNDDFHSSTYTL